MLFRDYMLWDRLSLEDAGTKTADIKVRDPISEIILSLRWKNSTTNNQNNWISRNIQALEIIDGAKVLWSLDGEEAFGVACDYYKAFPSSEFSEIPNDVQMLNLVIPFGRFYGDREYAFDPTRLVNPQVRLTWDAGAVRDLGVTSFLTDYLTASICCRIMEGVAAPAKMLSWKEVKKWTTADGTRAYIDLPVDAPYRKMLLRPVVAAYSVDQLFETVKISCDNGKFVPLDMRWYEFVRGLMTPQQQLFYAHCYNLQNGDTAYQVLKMLNNVVINTSQPDRLCAMDRYGVGGRHIMYSTAHDYAAITTDENLFFAVTGWAPDFNIIHDFGREQDPATWFPTRDFGDVSVELVGESAAATAYLALQQEVTY